MDFKYLSNLIYIMVVLVIGAIIWFGARKKDEIRHAMGLTGKESYRVLRNGLIIVGVLFIIFALLGPQVEDGIREVDGEGLDIYVLIDTSKSMLATDIKPSRMQRSKKIIEAVLEGLSGDRIGFIPYASSAYIQMPLTDDYDLGNMFLNVVDTNMIGGGGTDLIHAISLAARSFNESSEGDKVLLILSDGEEHESDLNDLKEFLQEASLKVFSVGIGTKEGSLIPNYNSVGEVVGYKKDENGEPVLSKLNEGLLMDLATISDGNYYESTVGMDEINLLLEDIEGLKRGTNAPKKIKFYRQLFQWFLGLGILCLSTAFLLPKRRGGY